MMTNLCTLLFNLYPFVLIENTMQQHIMEGRDDWWNYLTHHKCLRTSLSSILSSLGFSCVAFPSPKTTTMRFDMWWSASRIFDSMWSISHHHGVTTHHHRRSQETGNSEQRPLYATHRPYQHSHSEVHRLAPSEQLQFHFHCQTKAPYI